jgi:YEATS family
MTQTRKYWIAAALFMGAGAALLVGKLFLKLPLDSSAVALFLIIWIPFIIPILRRLKYKDLEIEFIERAVKEVQADVATLANQTEIEKDHSKPDIKVDPTQIRIRHQGKKLDENYYRVWVRLVAPPEFMQQVKKVVYRRHETFREQFKEVSKPPFEDSFTCWGEFTIKAEIELFNGQTLRRQRYLTLTDESDATET